MSTPDVEQLLGSLEAKIMNDLWEHGEATVNDTLSRINANQSKQLAYNTVMSVMARLARKSLLERRRDGRAHIYWPAQDRETFLQQAAEQAAGRLLDDFGDLAVRGFVDQVSDEHPELLNAIRHELNRETSEDGE